MEGYGFNEENELKEYKKAISPKEYINYCSWEEKVLKRYQNITELKYFINLRAYLMRKYNICSQLHETMTSLWIPLVSLIIAFALVIPSVFIGITQYQDSIQSDLDNTYIENMIRDKSDRNIIIEEQVDNFQSRIDQNSASIKGVFIAMYVLLALIVALGAAFAITIKVRLTKMSFYKDYISIIDKAITNLTK